MTTSVPHSEVTRLTGRVVRIDRDRGYGFIRDTCAGDGEDFFIHVGDFPDRGKWLESQPVTFLPGPRDRKRARRALDVQIAEAE